MKTTTLLAALVAAGLSAGTAAAPNPAPPRARAFVDPVNGMTLAQLFDAARTREPGLRASALGVQALEADATQAALRANPRLSFEQREEIGGMDRQTELGAEWPLELFRRAPRVALARAEVTVAAENVRDRERLLLNDIRMAYTRYLAAARTVAVLDELSAQATATLRLLDSRAAAGAIPRLERDQASVEAGRVEAARLRAIGAAEMARSDVQRAAGLMPVENFTLRETLEAAVPWSDVDLLASAPAGPVTVSGRADIRAAEAQVAAEHARRDDAKARGRVDLSVFGGYMRMLGGFPQQGLGAAGTFEPIRGVFHNVTAGVMIDVPLFNRNQGEVAAAGFRASAAEQELEQRRLAAVSEVQIAAARLRAARDAARVFTGELRDTARRNVDVVREAYGLGRNTLLEVVAEQKRYLEVEMAYTDALMEVLEAHAAFVAAAGR